MRRRILLWVGLGTLTVGLLGLTLGSLLAAPAVSRRTQPAASVDPLVGRGAQLYATHCQTCHGDRQGRGRLPNAPPHNQEGHTWHHSDRHLTEIILNGSGAMGEMMRRMMGVPEGAPRMPAFKDKLSEDDVRAILAFIKTWWTPEQRAIQEKAPMMP